MNKDLEALRKEFNELPDTDKRAVANHLKWQPIGERLEGMLRDGIATMGLSPDLSDELFNLSKNPNATEEQINAFMAKLPHS